MGQVKIHVDGALVYDVDTPEERREVHVFEIIKSIISADSDPMARQSFSLTWTADAEPIKPNVQTSSDCGPCPTCKYYTACDNVDRGWCDNADRGWCEMNFGGDFCRNYEGGK